MSISATLPVVLLEIKAFKFGWALQLWVDAEVTEVDTSKRICAFDLLKLPFELFDFIFHFFENPLHTVGYRDDYTGVLIVAC